MREAESESINNQAGNIREGLEEIQKEIDKQKEELNAKQEQILRLIN